MQKLIDTDYTNTYIRLRNITHTTYYYINDCKGPNHIGSLICCLCWQYLLLIYCRHTR